MTGNHCNQEYQPMNISAQFASIRTRLSTTTHDILTLAAVYLAFYLYTVTQIPTVLIPPEGSDPYFYSIIAQTIRQHGILLRGLPVYFFAPLYAYFVAAIDMLVPHTVALMRTVVFVQCALFFSSIYIFRRCVQQLVSPQAGRLAMYLYALYPPFIFYSVIPVKDSITIACMVYALYAFLRFTATTRWRWTVVLGLLLGCMIHLRGTMALLVPLLFLAVRAAGSWRKALVFIGCTAVCIAPFCVRNYFVAGEPVLLTPISGIHSYIGNNRFANGMYTYVRGVRASAFGHFYDAKRVAQKDTGHEMTAIEVNRYWKNKARSFVLSHPLSAVVLTVRKLFLMINYLEPPNNYNFDQFKRDYSLFGVLNLPYTFGLLFVVGMIGMVWGRYRYRGFLITVFVLIGAGTLMVFVTGRYRLPLAVPLLISSVGLIDNLRSGSVQVTRAMIITAFILLVAAWYPSLSDRDVFLDRARSQDKQARSMLARFNDQPAAQFESWFRRKQQAYIKRFTATTYIK